MERFPRHWPCMMRIHCSAVVSPHTKGQWGRLWCFLRCLLKQTFNQTVEFPVIWEAMTLTVTSLCWRSTMTTLSLSRRHVLPILSISIPVASCYYTIMSRSHIDTSRPSHVYFRNWIKSARDMIMVSRLSDTPSLSEHMLTYHSLGPWALESKFPKSVFFLQISVQCTEYGAVFRAREIVVFTVSHYQNRFRLIQN